MSSRGSVESDRLRKPRNLAGVFGKVVMLDIGVYNKQEVVSKMVAAICDRAQITKTRRNQLQSKIMEREGLGSTGIGWGAAIPHAKVKGLKTLLAAFARSAEPIDFDAVDGRPVQLFFMLLSPEEDTAEYTQALVSVSQAIVGKHFCNFLRKAKNEKEVVDILREIELSGA